MLTMQKHKNTRNLHIPASLIGLQSIRLGQFNGKYDAKQPTTYDTLGCPYLSLRPNTITKCSLNTVQSHFLISTLRYTLIFRLDALAKALSVIATATWLGGWLGGRLGGWLAGCLSQPVLYQNDKTYPKTFCTIW